MLLCVLCKLDSASEGGRIGGSSDSFPTMEEALLVGGACNGGAAVECKHARLEPALGLRLEELEPPWEEPPWEELDASRCWESVMVPERLSAPMSLWTALGTLS